MIPNKNKKKTLEATVNEMRDFSLVYIEKYSPSKQQLKTYLLKKYLKLNSTNINKNKVINNINNENEDQDFFSAIKICKKKRIGPARDENNRPLFSKKDLGILARQGFDFETSKKVINLEKEDYLKIINLL